MTSITFEITSYKINLSDRLSMGGKTFPGYITCLGKNLERITLYFYYDGDARNPDYTDLNRKLGYLSLSIKEMHLYIDLLRNEKPVYGYLNSDHPEWNLISTSYEPVGDGEIN